MRPTARRGSASTGRTAAPEGAAPPRRQLAAATLPDDLDPAEFVAARGAQELQRLVDGAQPLLKYGIDRRLAAHDLSRAEGRAAALSDALAVLAPIKDSLLAKDYAVQIAGRVRAREQDVLDGLRAPRPAPSGRGDERRPRVRGACAGVGRAFSGAFPLLGAAGAQGAPSEASGRRQAAARAACPRPSSTAGGSSASS